MTSRAPIVAIVLAAFAATIDVRGPLVVSHHHRGGEPGHVHAFVEHAPDGSAHRHVGLPEHADDAGRARHGDGLFAWDGEPAEHVHVVSPFRPATSIDTTLVARVTTVGALEIAPPPAPTSPSLLVSCSRGPPPAAHV